MVQAKYGSACMAENLLKQWVKTHRETSGRGRSCLSFSCSSAEKISFSQSPGQLDFEP